MYQPNLRARFLTGIGLLGLLLIGTFQKLRAASPSAATITLDPICEAPEARNVPLPPGHPAPSTLRMAKLLAEFRKTAEPEAMAYMSDRMVASLETTLAATTNVAEKLKLRFQLGLQQIQAGQPDRALNNFAALEKEAEADGGHMAPRTLAELRMRKALAYLRLGEQENCLLNENADSCVFPLKPPAYHLLPRGSRGAIALLNEQLEQSPNDLSSRWLLNLAHMTLGEYPQKVPPRFLIAPERFASEYPMPAFRNVSQGLGLDEPDLAGGVIIDDFDNDGFYDIVISAWDLDGQLRIFHNNR